MDQLYPHTALNMVRVLEKVGCQVHYNPAQTCCGQPAYNAGYKAESRDIARKFLDDFPTPAAPRYVVSPSASCVGMVRNAYPLFADTPDGGPLPSRGPAHLRANRVSNRRAEHQHYPRRGAGRHLHLPRLLRGAARVRHPRSPAPLARWRGRPLAHRDGRNHHLLRLRRHLRREV
ncbi:MAG: (Fe-S)-binding protein [Hymenobacter sp.]